MKKWKNKKKIHGRVQCKAISSEWMGWEENTTYNDGDPAGAHRNNLNTNNE